ncbi:MAG: patatin-like phospholipase family protein [Bacteroidales bacterium]|nr:patatin-like phospholipase family protein [Bacteroidales bacterium]
MKNEIIILILLLLCYCSSLSQKVGLVLSGGGAKGLAHIGVIKALEEHRIPIDYVVGTSMGAIIGGLYASGYTPDEMIKIVTSEEFLMWAEGKIPKEYDYFYIKEKEKDASWIDLKFSIDSGLVPYLPTNIIPPYSMDLAFLEIFAQPSAAASYNFDSLFVPFRCVASDIYNNEPVIFSKGDLGSAIRASMTFPFYFKPITVDGKLLFDGGVYNNFPVDIMIKDFNPNYLIGSKVAGNTAPPTEDNVLLQLENMITAKTNYEMPDSISILIEPQVYNYSLMDFSKAEEIIKIGYQETLNNMKKIKQLIPVREDTVFLNYRRKQFKKKFTPLIFKNVYITGLNYNQVRYLLKELYNGKDSFNYESFKREYYKILSGNYVSSIFPRAKLLENKYYSLFLNVSKEKPLKLSLGGLISSDNQNEGFVALEYNLLRKIGYSFYSNMYYGKFYSSLYLRARFENVFILPLIFQSALALSRYDFYKGSNFLFYNDYRPIYIITSERILNSQVLFPLTVSSKISFNLNFFDKEYNYFQNTNFNHSDTSDYTQFHGFSPFIIIEKNSLNDINFPVSGSNFTFKLAYLNGKEKFKAGSYSNKIEVKGSFKQWFMVNVEYCKYYNITKKVISGIYQNVVISNQPFFSNYYSTLLVSSSFTPVLHLNAFYTDKLRNPSFIGLGLKFIYRYNKYFNVRVENYLFSKFNEIVRTPLGIDEKTYKFSSPLTIHTLYLVYSLSAFNISMSFNYYPWHNRKTVFTQLNIGYMVFNKL